MKAINISHMSLLGREETISGMAATANKSQTSFRTCGEIVIKSRYKVSTETSNFVDHKRCENSFDHHPMLCTMTCMYHTVLRLKKDPKSFGKLNPLHSYRLLLCLTFYSILTITSAKKLASSYMYM